MGYLSNDGNTLNYTESLPFLEQLKKDGVTQFLHLLKKYQHYTSADMAKQSKISNNSTAGSSYFPSSEKSGVEPIYWGDEIEGHVVQVEAKHRIVSLATDLSYFFESIHAEDAATQSVAVMPEYGAWMIETVPTQPYCTINNLDAVLTNLKERTAFVQRHLKPEQKVLLTSTFPLLGDRSSNYYNPNMTSQSETLVDSSQSHDHCTIDNAESTSLKSQAVITKNKEQTLDNNNFVNTVTQSLFIDDRIINPHPRFPTLSQNIRMRRKEKVNIQIPLFIDAKTPLDITEIDPYPGKIYMDAMAFGMGSSCIQTTFSARNLSHARRLYDQMSILSPLFLAMTASSPIFRGRLAGIDTRWEVISASVDCRTSEERDPLSSIHIPKSRYASISTYISDEPRNLASYNDSKFPLNKSIMDFAREESTRVGVTIDENLIDHLGFLFARDPLVLFDQKIKIDNTVETAHFENIQSTNWNSVRLKPPPSMNSSIGWRFEFRTMESQLTNDENAAFMLLSHILVRLFFESNQLNFYIPISKVNENFARQSSPNAVLTQKFYFRVNVFDDGEPEIAELTLHEIFFGKTDVFAGLYAISSGIWNDMMKKVYGSDEKVVFEQVWSFIRERTQGTKQTAATWIRNYVRNHPEYAYDSKITSGIAFDLIQTITGILDGTVSDPNFTTIF